MNIQQKIIQVIAGWQKKCLSPSCGRSKATLQRAIEDELIRLKQENTPLSKQMPQHEKQPSTYLSKPILSDIFQR